MSVTETSTKNSDNKIVLGFWHNWPATGGQGYKGVILLK